MGAFVVFHSFDEFTIVLKSVLRMIKLLEAFEL